MRAVWLCFALAACGGSDDEKEPSRATGGTRSSTGGATATGGSSEATGGTVAATGGAPTSTGGVAPESKKWGCFVHATGEQCTCWYSTVSAIEGSQYSENSCGLSDCCVRTPEDGNGNRSCHCFAPGKLPGGVTCDAYRAALATGWGPSASCPY